MKALGFLLKSLLLIFITYTLWAISTMVLCLAWHFEFKNRKRWIR